MTQKWACGEFERSVSAGKYGTVRIATPGYVCGAFGVSQFCGNRTEKWPEWFVFHRQTGCSVAAFKAKRIACEYVDRLLRRGDWLHLSDSEINHDFTKAQDEVRAEMGLKPIRLRSLG